MNRILNSTSGTFYGPWCLSFNHSVNLCMSALGASHEGSNFYPTFAGRLNNQPLSRKLAQSAASVVMRAVNEPKCDRALY